MTVESTLRAPRPGKRRAILDAADTVVRRDGVEALTLEAVAREAHVSKGGLLYHFPNKDALIAGLIARAVESFDSTLAVHLSAGGEPPGAWLSAFVAASFDEDALDIDANAGLLAAVAINPALLDPVRARYAAWQAQTEADGIDPTVATIIRLAVDGLAFADLFGFAPPRGPARDRLRATLLAMAGGTEP